ncbi:MAG: anti-sigma factor family protein, partial [bacterium]
MTNPIQSNMTCEQLADVLPDFLERELDDATRDRVDAHAALCAECGALVADLRTLRVDAANLPVRAPSRDLWAGIAARIETPVVEITPGRGTVERWSGEAVERENIGRPARRISLRWAGLAAAGIVAVTAAVTHELTSRTIVVTTASAVPTTPPNAAASNRSVAQSDTVQPFNRSTVPPVSLASNKPSAEDTFDSEIKRLRIIVAARRASLDTTTIAVIDKNLKVIDDAIAQCRAALQRDPASRYLLESLNDALDTKVQLLRTAATLPSRS